MLENQLNNLEQIPFAEGYSSPHYHNVIAGPCSAETEKQVRDTAIALCNIGIKVFRAGLWKPRSSPSTFEGVGAKGLKWLIRAKEETGMLIATEVATSEHVKLALDAGFDVLWIGARTTTNPFVTQEIADALNGKSDTIVLVKNPVTPDIELWIGALQRINNAGIKKLGAIHRGFSAYGNHLYRNMPQWRIAIELKRRFPTLPIFSDPSHMGGKRELVPTLSQQALDMGFDGLFIESHCNPCTALSDARQQLSPSELETMLKSLIIRRTTRSTDNIDNLRQEIDRCDDELVEVLNKRMAISREIGIYKKEHDIKVVQTNRFDEILRKRVNQASQLGMSAKFMEAIMSVIHEESVRQQVDILSRSKDIDQQ